MIASAGDETLDSRNRPDILAYSTSFHRLFVRHLFGFGLTDQDHYHQRGIVV
jgi:hypothetical protein